MKQALKQKNDIFIIEDERTSSVDLVLDKIKELIIEKQIKPGDLLPSETVMAKSLKVSRGSLRESMKILSAFGVIEIKRGDGTYITIIANKKIFDPLLYSLILKDADFTELIELREGMESLIVTLIIRHASNEDIKKLEDIYLEHKGKVDAGVDDLKILNKMDQKFHSIMGEITKNHLLANIYDFVIELFGPTMNGKYGHESHKQLLDSFIKRDIDLAIKYVRENIEIWKKTTGFNRLEIPLKFLKNPIKLLLL